MCITHNAPVTSGWQFLRKQIVFGSDGALPHGHCQNDLSKSIKSKWTCSMLLARKTLITRKASLYWPNVNLGWLTGLERSTRPCTDYVVAREVPPPPWSLSCPVVIINPFTLTASSEPIINTSLSSHSHTLTVSLHFPFSGFANCLPVPRAHRCRVVLIGMIPLGLLYISAIYWNCAPV